MAGEREGVRGEEEGLGGLGGLRREGSGCRTLPCLGLFTASI